MSIRVLAGREPHTEPPLTCESLWRRDLACPNRVEFVLRNLDNSGVAYMCGVHTDGFLAAYPTARVRVEALGWERRPMPDDPVLWDNDGHPASEAYIDAVLRDLEGAPLSHAELVDRWQALQARHGRLIVAYRLQQAAYRQFVRQMRCGWLALSGILVLHGAFSAWDWWARDRRLLSLLAWAVSWGAALGVGWIWRRTPS